MSDGLSGKVALITGASSGIGEAIALALASAKVNCVIAGRRANALDQLARRIEAQGVKVHGLAGDIADEAFATSLVEDAISRHSRLDILVNAAGIMPEGGILDARTDRWREVIETNLLGSLYTCAAAAKHMKARGAGDIVNISSTAGRRSTALFASYSASKFGLTAMTEGLRQEMGEHGVRVCLIEPGATRTALTRNVCDDSLRDAIRARSRALDAMEPGHVAEAVIFALSLPANVNVSELLVRPTKDITPH